MTDSRIQMLDDLGREFSRVGRESRQRKPFRPWRTPLLAGVLALALSGGAVAGALTLVAGDETAGLSGLRERGTLATGTTDDQRGWLLTSARSDDAFCIALRVSGPDARGPRTAENCGGMTPGRFEATLYQERARGPYATALLYGTAPEDAATVSVGSEEDTRTASVVDDERDVPGRFFLVELPQEWVASPQASSETTIALADEEGNPVTEGASVTDLVAQSSPY